MSDDTLINKATEPGGSIVRDIDKGGKKTQVVTLDLGGSGAESLVAGAIPVTGAFYPATQPVSVADQTLGVGDLTADAWGVQKMSLPYSLFHGMWTFDIPASMWFMYENGVQVYTSTNIVSTGGAAVLTTSAAKSELILEGRVAPRYQPNRGHLYSTALWCPNKTNNGVREWGLETTENCICFKLKADGKLYAELRSGGASTYEAEIDTSGIAGFDVQKGNVYDIQYQWRGVGNYKFFINLQLVHTIANLGTLTALSVENPALPISYRATRTTQDVSIHIGCADITSENGSDNDVQPSVAYANISRNGTDVPVISIYNPLQIDGKTNTRTIYPNRVTFSCDKKAVFKVWRHRDPALLTGETFAAIGNGSYVQTDSPDTVAGAVAATAGTVTGMKLIDVVNVQALGAGASQIPTTFSNISMVRGDYLTITVTTASGLCDVVVSWGEAV
jgi:stage V sporulation protein SpoVS